MVEKKARVAPCLPAPAISPSLKTWVAVPVVTVSQRLVSPFANVTVQVLFKTITVVSESFDNSTVAFCSLLGSPPGRVAPPVQGVSEATRVRVVRQTPVLERDSA